MKVAIIPARGGSKRIPQKNIKNFAGKPIIAYSIEAAWLSGSFDEIIVSTDDETIAEVAGRLGATVPFVRPADLSDDFTGTTDVIAHALQWYRDNQRPVDLACCLYATAPFVLVDDLREGLARLQAGGEGRDFVFSATPFSFPPQRGFIVEDDGAVHPLHPEHRQTRSQELPTVYHDAAQFYWGRADAWIERRPIYGPRSTIVKLPHWRVQDIDTPDDWRSAELMFQSWKVTDD